MLAEQLQALHRVQPPIDITKEPGAILGRHAVPHGEHAFISTPVAEDQCGARRVLNEFDAVGNPTFAAARSIVPQEILHTAAFPAQGVQPVRGSRSQGGLNEGNQVVGPVVQSLFPAQERYPRVRNALKGAGGGVVAYAKDSVQAAYALFPGLAAQGELHEMPRINFVAHQVLEWDQY